SAGSTRRDSWGPGDGAGEDPHPVELREGRPIPEDVTARRVDSIENREAPLHGRADLEPEPAGKGRAEGRSLEEDGARALAFEPHERLPSAVRRAARDRAFLDAEAREVFLRDVHAPLRPVDRHVLPEIDELQRRADAIGENRGETPICAGRAS